MKSPVSNSSNYQPKINFYLTFFLLIFFYQFLYIFLHHISYSNASSICHILLIISTLSCFTITNQSNIINNTQETVFFIPPNNCTVVYYLKTFTVPCSRLAVDLYCTLLEAACRPLLNLARGCL